MNTENPASLHRSCVAIVDDDEDLRLLLRHALELRGFTVMEFESTEEALGWESPAPPPEIPPLARADLILLDVNLPGISGIETIQLIKQTPSIRNIPIAMLSAHGEVDVVLRCVKAGANDYFVKPLDFPEVMRRVDKLLADPSGTLHRTSQSVVSWNFQEYLIREIKRAERNEEPLGLLLGGVRKLSQSPDPLNEDEIAFYWSQPSSENTPDRERFESFLDSIRANLREYDLVVPFGTAEFAIVLPDTLPFGTRTVVRKLHALFQTGSPFPSLPRQQRWTLLVGMANYPENGRDRLALVSSAERNLTERIPEKPTSSSAEDLVFSKTIRCLSCGRHYTCPKVAVRRLIPIGRDTDFRMVFDEIDPLLYSVIACPHCGFACSEHDLKRVQNREIPAFRWRYRKVETPGDWTHPIQTIVPDELEESIAPPYEAWIEESDFSFSLRTVPERMTDTRSLIEEIRVRKEGTDLPRPESAIAAHLLARQVYEILGASPLRRARLAHRIAWLYRIAENKIRETEFLSEALDFYKTALHFEDLAQSKPSELEILFLLGELSFRIGREADAVRVFEHLVRDPRLEEKESFKKMIHRRWYEMRNEEPGPTA